MEIKYNKASESFSHFCPTFVPILFWVMLHRIMDYIRLHCTLLSDALKLFPMHTHPSMKYTAVREGGEVSGCISVCACAHFSTYFSVFTLNPPPISAGKHVSQTPGPCSNTLLRLLWRHECSNIASYSKPDRTGFLMLHEHSSDRNTQ